VGKNPAFQFYPSDWTRDLDDQDLEIEGAWIRIVCRLWWSETRGEATKPLKEWARILRKTEQKTMKIFQILIEKHIADGSLLDNQNITIISRRMKRMVEISKLRYEVGLKGGNPALLKTQNNLVNQTSNQNVRSSSSSSSSNNKPPLPPKKRGDEYETDFLTFWNAYPKKAKKPNAYREWKKLGSKRPGIAALTACIQKQATWRPWIEGYIPDPERWLKNERWLDEPPPAGGNGNGKGIRTSRTDPRDPALQSREDAEVAAIIARREAAKQSARSDTGGNAKPDDEPDLPGVQLTG
jgi:hypothetical protein